MYPFARPVECIDPIAQQLPTVEKPFRVIRVTADDHIPEKARILLTSSSAAIVVWMSRPERCRRFERSDRSFNGIEFMPAAMKIAAGSCRFSVPLRGIVPCQTFVLLRLRQKVSSIAATRFRQPP